ncbi:hypothetical protein [Qipengyuania sp. MTN3-11]|uniref:hypothetical protein n=1 Tax=Qipengyuania sp. MTN3-11 TaxID=3056557 RepID=UPI0036F39630
MATRKSGTRARRWVLIVIVVAALAALAWWRWGGGLRDDATAGTAYMARVACSCRYVGGRSMEDCEKDRLAGMEIIRLSDDPQFRSVTASAYGIASATASYREGYGCVLEEWEG